VAMSMMVMMSMKTMESETVGRACHQGGGAQAHVHPPDTPGLLVVKRRPLWEGGVVGQATIRNVGGSME